ncbi:MAG: hypothetical protein LBI10_09695 [Deltaproteobacteria bacterium]|jgi:hypothetical protein|nr:hypothetical protein [Deltaproteobacteria bacterium]
MLWLVIGLWASFVLFNGEAYGYVESAFLGGWPGVCENDTCYDDGQPTSDPPATVHELVLEHQLVSQTCPTDLIYLVFKHPSNTGSPALDQRLATEMSKRFEGALKWAESLSCADFFGCEGECLPVGLEIRHYVQQSGPGYLSTFRVERLNGNNRQGFRLKGSARYSFHNYRLTDGGDLTINDIFPEPNKSIPLFWAKVAQSLKNKGDCPLNSYKVNNRRVKLSALEPNDLLLSRRGATVSLEARAPCRPRAVDLAASELIALGADPALWGRK